MHFLTLILGITLLPKAFTLKCNRCLPKSSGSCSNIESVCLSPSHHCGTMRITSYAGGSELAQIHMKTCVPVEECAESSVNFGISRNVITSICCTSDLCNNQTAPEPRETSANGKRCYYCDGQRCSASLHCEGSEDYCFSKKTVMTGGEMKITKGCASKLMCTNMGHPQIRAALGGEISCCLGDFCNSATSTSAGLLLLVAPLVSLVMFS